MDYFADNPKNADCLDSPLPIELTSLHARQEGSAIRVRYHTGSRLNSDVTYIECAKDAVRFHTVGEQTYAQPNSLVPEDYSITIPLAYIEQMTGPLRDGQTLYFRLKDTDLDGSYRYSYLVSVEVRLDDAYSHTQVWPNPAQGLVTVSTVTPQNLSIFDVNGRRLRLLEVHGPGTTVPIDDLGPGIYFFHFSNGEGHRLLVK